MRITTPRSTLACSTISNLCDEVWRSWSSSSQLHEVEKLDRAKELHEQKRWRPQSSCRLIRSCRRCSDYVYILMALFWILRIWIECVAVALFSINCKKSKLLPTWFRSLDQVDENNSCTCKKYLQLFGLSISSRLLTGRKWFMTRTENRKQHFKITLELETWYKKSCWGPRVCRSVFNSSRGKGTKTLQQQPGRFWSLVNTAVYQYNQG